MGLDRGLSCPLGCSIYIYGWSDEKGGEDGDDMEGKEWKLPGLLYANDLVLCGESEKEWRAMVGQIAESCRSRGLKQNTGKGKTKAIVLNGEKGLECKLHIGGIRLEHVSEFKNLGCVLDKAGIDGAECSSVEVPSGS